MAQTVLVVDDDPLTQRVLQRYLERAGYEMKSARNGREALRLAKRALPQLIIVDYWPLITDYRLLITALALEPAGFLSGTISNGTEKFPADQQQYLFRVDPNSFGHSLPFEGQIACFE